MNKVLIKICVPATADCFDMFVPTDVPIQNIRCVIADGVMDLTNGEFLPSGCECLCLKEPLGVLNPSLTLDDYGLRDGMCLYLI